MTSETISERFQTDILAELQSITPFAERHEAAMARYDEAERLVREMSTRTDISPAEREALIAEHHAAEIDALASASHIEQLAA